MLNRAYVRSLQTLSLSFSLQNYQISQYTGEHACFQWNIWADYLFAHRGDMSLVVDLNVGSCDLEETPITSTEATWYWCLLCSALLLLTASSMDIRRRTRALQKLTLGQVNSYFAQRYHATEGNVAPTHHTNLDPNNSGHSSSKPNGKEKKGRTRMNRSISRTLSKIGLNRSLIIYMFICK